MRFLFYNWQRKVIAVLVSVIIWQFINHSILDTKTIAQVPVKIINLPPGKTIGGMLPHGVLAKRISLTLTGTKNLIEKLEPGDFEVQVDASGFHLDDWNLQVKKGNLISLNPSVNLTNGITQVTHQDYILHLSPLVTEKVPVTVLKPKGEPPPGYEFLDIWPQRLMQSVSGPQRDISEMKAQGLEIAFNLEDITIEELNQIQNSIKNQHDDEVSYPVPKKWKTVGLPFYRNPQTKEINDPTAQNLRIDFLCEQLLPVERDLPIRAYYPADKRGEINPKTYPIQTSEAIEDRDSITYLTTPLFARNVSKIFLDLVRDHLELAIIAAPRESGNLEWSLQIINPNKLEDIYTDHWLKIKSTDQENTHSPQNEKVYRKRFRNYMQKLKLFIDPETPLNFHSHLVDTGIEIHVDNAR